MQWRQATLIPCHDVSALVDQKPDRRLLAGQDREDQGRLAVIALRIDLGTLGHSRFDRHEVTIARRIVERPRHRRRR